MEKEKGKINVVVLILIIILVLVAGIAGGYFLGISLENKDGKQTIVGTAQTKPQEANTIQNTQTNVIANTEVNQNAVVPSVANQIDEPTNTVEPAATPQTQTINYDGSKTVVINGKNYTIASKSEIQKNNEGEEYTIVDLYLNDKKVKTINMGWIYNEKHEFGAHDYEFQLHEFCQNYILVEIKGRLDNGYSQEVNRVQFCILNTEGECIDTLKWDDATQISVAATNERLSYKIEKDSLIIQEDDISMEYKVKNDYIEKKVLKVYKEGELFKAGK